MSCFLTEIRDLSVPMAGFHSIGIPSAWELSTQAAIREDWKMRFHSIGIPSAWEQLKNQ